MRSIAYGTVLAILAVAAEAAEAPPDLTNEPALPVLMESLEAATPETPYPGSTYRVAELAAFGLRVHAFGFDPALFRVRVAEQAVQTGQAVNGFLERADDVFAINGGFFERDEDTKALSPSGLLVVDGKLVAPEHDRAGSGVVYVAGDNLRITYRKTAPPPSEMAAGIQVGPVLVDPGGKVGIYKNAGDRPDRSAVCLTAGGGIVFVVVDGGLSLFTLATILAAPEADGGFGCDVALNLDGGPSTQATYRAGGRMVEIPGDWPVENGLVVSTRRR